MKEVVVYELKVLAQLGIRQSALKNIAAPRGYASVIVPELEAKRNTKFKGSDRLVVLLQRELSSTSGPTDRDTKLTRLESSKHIDCLSSWPIWER